MRIEGEFTVDALPEDVWRVIMDPETLCRLADSCEEARRLDETHYEGIMRVKLALLSFRAFVNGEITSMRPPESMTVRLAGRTEGLPGTFQGTLQLSLRPVSGRSAGRYAFEMDMLGKLGALGQPFLAQAARRLAASFSAKVGRYIHESGGRSAARTS